MTELLGLNARGDLTMGVPPAELIKIRKQSSGTYYIDIGLDLWAPVDVEWVARMQRTLTAALIDGGDVEHVTTPESLAREEGAA